MTGQPIDCIAAFREPGARVELLDQLGVQRALMFPTSPTSSSTPSPDDPDLTHVAIHAINHWLHDHMDLRLRVRIFATPVITLPILDEAITELEWVLERGAKIVLVRPAPANGLRGPRSIALPEFDPFWARVQEAGIPSRCTRRYSGSPPTTRRGNPGTATARSSRARSRSCCSQHREIEDAIAAMICRGRAVALPRPTRVERRERGGLGRPPATPARLRVPEDAPGVRRAPRDVFRRNVYINPFWEDDVAEVIALCGLDHVLFGSDFRTPRVLRHRSTTSTRSVPNTSTTPPSVR